MNKYFVVVLAILLLFCLNIFPTDKVFAEKCLGTWDIQNIRGIKPDYKPQEQISGSFNYLISNSSDCPNCVQQILIGIVDQSGVKVTTNYPACVYTGTPKACPAITSGSFSFTFSVPANPGTYRIIACNSNKDTCEVALQNFPAAPEYTKEIASITVSTAQPSSSQASVSPVLQSPSESPIGIIVVLFVVLIGIGIIFSSSHIDKYQIFNPETKIWTLFEYNRKMKRWYPTKMKKKRFKGVRIKK